MASLPHLQTQVYPIFLDNIFPPGHVTIMMQYRYTLTRMVKMKESLILYVDKYMKLVLM